MKRFFIFFLLIFCLSPIFCTVKLGNSFGVKKYINDKTKNEDIDFSAFQIIKPRVDFTVYKNLDIISEYEFDFAINTKIYYVSSVFILGLENSFKLPLLFYLRPSLKFGLFGTTTSVYYGSGPFFELGISLAKSVPLRINELQFYSDIAWRKERSSMSSIIFDIGMCYVFRKND